MKLNKFIIPLILLCGGMAISLAQNVSSVSTEALFTESDIINENFDKKELDSSNWLLRDATFNVERYGFRLNPQNYLWGNMILNQNVYLEDDYTLDIDVKSLADSDTGGKWLAVAFGMKNATSTFADAPFAFIFYSNYICGMNGTYCDFEQAGYLQPHQDVNLFATPFIKYNTFSKVRFHVDIFDSLTSYIYFDILDESGKIIKEHGANDVYLVNRSLDGYVGFNNSGVSTEMSNFVLRDVSTGLVLYEDDFSDSTIQYKTSGSGAWRTDSFSQSEAIIGPISNVKLNKDKSSISYKTKITNSKYERVDVAFVAQVDINYLPMSLNSLCGLEINKERIDKNGFIAGIKKEKFGYQLMALDKDRNLITSDITSINAPGSTVTLTLEYSNTGRVDLYTDDLFLTFEIETFDGYIGVSNISLDGNTCSGPYIDNFVLSKVIDKEDNSPDVSINFNGTKDTTIGSRTFKNFFVSNREWTMTKTSQITLANYGSKIDPDNPNGYLCFNSATESSVFGTINKYRDFVVRFDVEILTEVENLEEHAGFALEFGSPSSKTLFDNVQSLGIFNTNMLDPKATLAIPNLCRLANGESSQSFPKSGSEGNIQFFEKRDGKAPKLNVMYIVKDGLITMHFKYDDEPESVLMNPRVTAYATRTTEGYVYVVGIGSISFNLDNFSITNLDYITKNEEYKIFGDGEYQTTTRKDFSTSQETSGLILENASYSKKSIRINDGGKVSTSGKTSDGLYRFKFKSIETQAELKFGDASICLVDDNKGKYLIGKDSTFEEICTLDDDFTFTDCNIEIIKQGNLFDVKLVSGNVPLSGILKDPITFQLNSGDTYNTFEIVSTGFTDLSSFLFANFDSHANIEKRDYDPEKDEFDPWPERTPIQEKDKKKSGCGSSIISSSIIISLIALAVVCLLVFKRRISYEEK